MVTAESLQPEDAKEEVEIRSPKRVVFVVTSAITATAFLKGYLRFLRGDGWQVALICAPGNGLAQLAATEGVVHYPVPMMRDPSPIRDVVSLARLTILLRRLRPDVVVYATPKASLLAAIGGLLARVPARVYQQWGLRLETESGLYFRVLASIEWLTARLSTHMVANSESLAARVRELGLNAGRTVHVLGYGSSHGVDSDYFDPRTPHAQLDPETESWIARDRSLVVGYIGRLHQDKGIDTLLRALEICAEQGTVVRAVLVGADEGAGVSDALRTIRGEVDVRLVGEVKDTRPYLQAMDVLVLMSRREGFPNVVLEAAAMETPSIVADSTGTIDSVLHGITGLVVRTDDAMALARAVIQLDRDRTRIALLGQSARQRAIADFRQSAVWARHSHLFREAARERARLHGA